jgi:hypothetical protein
LSILTFRLKRVPGFGPRGDVFWAAMEGPGDQARLQ